MRSALTIYHNQLRTFIVQLTEAYHCEVEAEVFELRTSYFLQARATVGNAE